MAPHWRSHFDIHKQEMFVDVFFSMSIVVVKSVEWEITHI